MSDFDCVRDREGDIKRGGKKGGEEGKLFVYIGGGERTLLRGDRDSETESSHNENTARESQTGSVFLALGTARRLSLWHDALFLQSSSISQGLCDKP